MKTAIDYGAPPSPPGRGVRSRTALLIGLAVVVLAAVVVGTIAFTGGSDEVPDLGPIDRSAPPPTLSEEQKVTDALQKFFQYRDQAGAIPDPTFPLLSVHATGAELRSDVAAIQELKDQGLAAQRPPNTISEDRVTDVVIEGDKARATVCSISDGIVIHVDTGKPANDYPPNFAVTQLSKPELVREFGTWKVEFLNPGERWEGVAGCAVTS